MSSDLPHNPEFDQKPFRGWPDQEAKESDESRDLNDSLRILVVRPDRLGDVILSTPVFEVIRRHYPRSEITAMVRKSVLPVIRGIPSVHDTMVYDPDRRHRGVRGFIRLVRELRAKNFRIAVVLQSQWQIALALFLAQVRYRVGPLSKFHSFFFYNRGVRQHRSHVEMHETDYNLQLLRRIGIRVGTRHVPTQIAVPESSRILIRQWLETRGWDSGRTLVAVHPGMGGSALNWPEFHYIELIKTLLVEGKQVVVTSGPSEEALMKRVREGLGSLAEKAWFYGGKDVGPVDQLAALLSLSQLVIAPSTGPLHLAVALRVPVVTFYPPIRVQSAIRWGPYLPDESRASVLVPEVFCGEDFECRGSLCHYFPCMKGLTVTQALEQVNFQLSTSSPEVLEVPEVNKNVSTAIPVPVSDES